MSSANTSSAVADFYRNKNIFITGGTGFLGIAVIEKILRSLDVNNIYVLMRSKRGKSIDERLVDLTKNEIFETLLATGSADIFKKLIAIDGDVNAHQLGISPADRQRLTDNVHVVIHSAATLDFNETLRSTVNTNLLGTRSVMELCTQCRHMAALVHVSSAFVNSWLLDTKEVLYPVPADCAYVEEMVRKLNDEELAELTPDILKDHPNTYTFSKHLAEHEVNKYADRFPCGIVRPSMIQAAWKEPTPGWTISKNGPQGFLMGAAKGVVRRLPVAHNKVADYIPVDTVVNHILVTGQHVASKNDGQLTIFHCTTSTCNPFRWELVDKNVNRYLNSFPLMSSVWYPHLKFVSSLLMFRISAIFVHFLPALLLDTVTRLSGGRPIVWRLHRNIWNSLTLLQRFVFTEWRFDNARTLRLADEMLPADARDFGIDARSLDWNAYFLTLTQGVRRYLNREHPRNLARALRKNRILLVLHVLLHVGIYGLIWWLTKTFLDMSWSQTAIVLPFAYRLLNLL